ncbi:MAG TPA: ABC transporter, partial [Burkholderiaceae bacterium]
MTSFRSALAACALALLAGCSMTKTEPQRNLDLGPMTQTQPLVTLDQQAVRKSVLSALSVADVNVPVWLDNTGIHYRLLYGDARETRPYANSRWSMAPAALLGQRIKWRIAQS